MALILLYRELVARSNYEMILLSFLRHLGKLLI